MLPGHILEVNSGLKTLCKAADFLDLLPRKLQLLSGGGSDWFSILFFYGQWMKSDETLQIAVHGKTVQRDYQY